MRNEVRIMKKIIIALLMVALVFTGCDVSDVEDQVANVTQAEDEHILSVKKAHSSEYPNITYEQAFEYFFSSPTWKYFVGTSEGPDDDGDGEPDYTKEDVDVVEFTGYCTYDEKKVKALIQFELEEKTFSATYLSFNDVSQSALILGLLIGKAFEEYEANHGEVKNKKKDKSVETSNETKTVTKQKYSFVPAEVEDFYKSGKYLVIEMSAGKYIKTKGQKLSEIRLKIDENCVWRTECFNKSDGSKTSDMSSYGEIEEIIIGEIGTTYNFGLTTFKTKNDIITSFNYLLMI